MTSQLIAALSAATIGMISVGSIAIVLFLLACENGLSKARGYVVGYTLTYAAIGGGIIAASPDHGGQEAGRATALVSIVHIGAGLLFLSILAFRLLRRAETRSSLTVQFLTGSDVTFARAFGIGVIAPVINIKNLAIFAYAVSFIGVVRMNLVQVTFSILAVTLVFCSTVILPVVAYAAAPVRSANLFAALRRWLEAHSAVISNLVLCTVGLLFLFQGLSGFA